MGQNPLYMRDHEAAMEVIRRRRSEGVKLATGELPEAAWRRAFEAVIMFYEKNGERDMADLLRLDLDRFGRRTDEGLKVEWASRKDKSA